MEGASPIASGLRRPVPLTGEVPLPERKERTLLALEETNVHATELLRLEAREKAMLGKVFEMDRWLDEPNNRAADLHWRRVLRERDEALEQLRFNRTLIEAHEEANRQR